MTSNLPFDEWTTTFARRDTARRPFLAAPHHTLSKPNRQLARNQEIPIGGGPPKNLDLATGFWIDAQGHLHSARRLFEDFVVPQSPRKIDRARSALGT
jgi:hypothetical protein